MDLLHLRMDPLHLCIALGPLAVYLLLLGALNLTTRPFLTTGARDTGALGLAISGFIVAGPMELFMPEAAVARFGGFVWFLLIAFYGLCLTLLILLLRPRLVIYNITAEQLRPILANVVKQVDENARWAGESLVLPRLGVQLYVEPFASMRNVQLIASGPKQNYQGWRALELALSTPLRETKSPQNRYGYSMVFFGLLMVAVVTFQILTDDLSVAQMLREMLRQ